VHLDGRRVSHAAGLLPVDVWIEWESTGRGAPQRAVGDLRCRGGPTYMRRCVMTALLIGYARCSTDQQDLTAQHDGLITLGVSLPRIYVDATTPVRWLRCEDAVATDQPRTGSLALLTPTVGLNRQ